MALPNCLDCKHADQGYPCQKADGSYDFEKVARALVLYGRTFAVDGENLDPDARDQHAWAGDCTFEVEEEFPDLLLPLIAAAADACETPEDAAYISAGILENAVVKHGKQLIGSIEALAAESPKFRYLLSGIWSQSGRVDDGVWQRIAAAIMPGPRMDNDLRTPGDGDASATLNRDQVSALLRERLMPQASRLKTQNR